MKLPSMINQNASQSIILVLMLASGCRSYYATSLAMGNYSATTGKPSWPAAYYLPEKLPVEKNGTTTYEVSIENRAILNPAPFHDSQVLKYKSGLKLCQDTFRLPDLSRIRTTTGPGAIVFSPAGIAIDEAEITNFDWRLFVADVFPKGELTESILPDSSALPVKDYYTSPFYAYYPVVGISYEQAKLFCKWRTEAWSEVPKAKDWDGLLCEYRLPTEAEWEEAAEVRSGLPFGTNCTELPVRVAPGAAVYLQKRSSSTTPVSQIKKDIDAYNKKRPVRSWINCAQVEPYFLQLASPGYVYQGPANNFGLYQMLGNVAEMVEERGITKGGSYRDNLDACRIKARGSFEGPSPTVGFRCVCTVRKVK